MLFRRPWTIFGRPAADRGANHGGPVTFHCAVPRNLGFVGRSDDLESLHAILKEKDLVGLRPAGLTGMGSIGKTQFTVEYIYRYKRDYHGPFTERCIEK